MMNAVATLERLLRQAGALARFHGRTDTGEHDKAVDWSGERTINRKNRLVGLVQNGLGGGKILCRTLRGGLRWGSQQDDVATNPAIAESVHAIWCAGPVRDQP